MTAQAVLSAGPAHLALNVQEGPAPGTWRYNLTHGTRHRAPRAHRRMTSHLDVLRYAAGARTEAFEPETIEDACWSSSPSATWPSNPTAQPHGATPRPAPARAPAPPPTATERNDTQ